MNLIQAAWNSVQRVTAPLSELGPILLAGPKSKRVNFQCNVCGSQCSAPRENMTREEPTCTACRSTVRMRSVVRCLSLKLLGRSVPLPEFPIRKDLRGLGLSDWDLYAKGLARAFDYTNTFYDTEPRLDIKCVDRSLYGTLDFLVASDVFEHVSPPISPAFQNAKSLLKPGGLLVFSVPFALDDEDTREHFPELHDFQIIENGGARTLVNRTANGKVTEHTDLVFHGGGGLTLEMRLFTRKSLLRELQQAGFDQMAFHSESDAKYGVYWTGPYSLVLTARA
jgi:SAM-dependent methyltransferase